MAQCLLILSNAMSELIHIPIKPIDIMTPHGGAVRRGNRWNGRCKHRHAFTLWGRNSVGMSGYYLQERLQLSTQSHLVILSGQSRKNREVFGKINKKTR
jgi:hypothetical protein